MANIPDKAEGSHAHGLQIGVSLRCQYLEYLSLCVLPHLLVISNVVPKIWARTNSAIVVDAREGFATGAGGSVCGGVALEVVEERSAVGQQEVCDLGSARDWFGVQDRSRRRTAATRISKTLERIQRLFLAVPERGAWPGIAARWTVVNKHVLGR